MVEHRIATRYAKSLLDLGVEQNKLDVLNSDMTELQTALKNNDLYLLVKSPIIKADKKNAIFQQIFGGSFDKVTMAFLNIITNKTRETYLPEIVSAFMTQYNKLKHVSTVTVSTATALSEEALEKIKKTLLDSKHTDQKVEIVTKVDPALIGGFVIQMDDKLYDASIAYKLEQVKQQFTDNKYIKSI